MTRAERRNLYIGLAFISPWIIGFLAFTVYPVAASLYYSFCDYDVLTDPVWVGALNYQDMVSDAVFWKSLYNTFYFALFALPLGLLVSLLMAILLNQAVKGRSTFRTVFFIPSLVPIVASCMIWLWILNGKLGLLNAGLAWFGIEGPQWLSDEFWTKPAIILMSLWGCGNTIVIYLAALQDVPRSLYESADIDGAGFWTKFRHITVPLISPVIYFNLVMGIIGSLQVFAQAFVMLGGGGPNRSALFYAVYLFQNAFQYRQMGYASAMAWVLFILILLLTWLATAVTRKHIYYGGD
ncbi:MAG: sugar ABC transporter permease [Kiritimatiellae bacterium]|nr:sugar ABC transporter permease [Kiritimatiellia bacterium]MDD4737629.1 sugar ABC transporter permease [Kiritimatiellia bacterium]